MFSMPGLDFPLFPIRPMASNVLRPMRKVSNGAISAVKSIFGVHDDPVVLAVGAGDIPVEAHGSAKSDESHAFLQWPYTVPGSPKEASAMRISLIVLAGTLLGASLVAAPQTARLADTAAAGAAATATFYKDVLPVLQKNCQTCHRPGEVAPMSLLTYEQARPWARAIKTAVATRQMPPWFADPAYGHFANERRLSAREIDAINGWVDAGAPAGNPSDAPPPLTFENGWNIKPDVVVEMPKAFQTSGAQAPSTTSTCVVKGDFTEDLWVTRRGDASGQLEGAASRQGVGASAGIEVDGEGEPTAKRTNARSHRAIMGDNAIEEGNDILGKFNPGLGAQRFDMDGAAKFIPKGSDLVFELHYTTSGEPTADASQARARAREAGAEDALLLPRRTDGDEPRDSRGRRRTPRSSARSRSAKRRGWSTRSRTCTCAARTSSCASSHRTRRRRRC